uniref:Uncharacterized protein n=1 Tax=Palpitomonas bilix TaxID=652834 RepID=A0A7S3G3T7_9EUKA|mmetsp:Transcript_16726/g.41993  ORF Transcript_16726/g.41993 Transcript_16726/m.41993 type:complete len:305 (+) Transcript_16726:346-1260(+)
MHDQRGGREGHAHQNGGREGQGVSEAARQQSGEGESEKRDRGGSFDTAIYLDPSHPCDMWRRYSIEYRRVDALLRKRTEPRQRAEAMLAENSKDYVQMADILTKMEEEHMEDDPLFGQLANRLQMLEREIAETMERRKASKRMMKGGMLAVQSIVSPSRRPSLQSNTHSRPMSGRRSSAAMSASGSAGRGGGSVEEGRSVRSGAERRREEEVEVEGSEYSERRDREEEESVDQSSIYQSEYGEEGEDGGSTRLHASHVEGGGQSRNEEGQREEGGKVDSLAVVSRPPTARGSSRPPSVHSNVGM